MSSLRIGHHAYQDNASAVPTVRRATGAAPVGDGAASRRQHAAAADANGNQPVFNIARQTSNTSRRSIAVGFQIRDCIDVINSSGMGPSKLAVIIEEEHNNAAGHHLAHDTGRR